MSIATSQTTAPRVWRDYDQEGLDRAYDQTVWAPSMADIQKRQAANSEAARRRLGEPQRLAYGPLPIEGLDVFKARQPNAPVIVFIHGGAWLRGEAKNFAYPAEMFVDAGVNFVVADFAPLNTFDGDLTAMAVQVRRAIAFARKEAAQFGGDASRFYLAGHSSGAHLAAVALTSGWHEFGLAPDFIKGALLMSGMYDLKPVRLSKRSDYVRFTDAMEDAMSPQRHLERLHTPLTVTVGSQDSPEFIRQARDFVAAVKAAGKAAELVEAPAYNHFDLSESLGNPYGPNGRAALKLMGLR
ncbi:MAG TPA: alpha/beta hydrolase [Pseudolabrys sp.]|jgi:arylformamidase|nr:alpha/beta hydrolase [Pseudolabrys sp.]